MAVAWFRNPKLDRSVPLIDRHTVDERTFGVTRATKHPAYVFSVNKNACLIHRIADVELHWYALVDIKWMGRLLQPAAIARTVCGTHFSLRGERSRTCHVPNADALRCGPCHGEPRTFRRARQHGRVSADGVTREAAHVRLGCIVKGY
jgi:hypothetical protein